MATYYGDPTGNGNGTIENPWSPGVAMGIANSGGEAVSPNSIVVAGDLVYLRGGPTYNTPLVYTPPQGVDGVSAGQEFGAFTNNGTAANPIRFRPFPGEFVRIDGFENNNRLNPAAPQNARAVTLAQQYIEFYDFEICSTSTEDRQDGVIDGRGPLTRRRCAGVTLSGQGSAFINCIFHNFSLGGLASGGGGGGINLYGGLMFNCGTKWPVPPGQNDLGTNWYSTAPVPPNLVMRLRNHIHLESFGAQGFRPDAGYNSYFVERMVFLERCRMSVGDTGTFNENRYWDQALEDAPQPGVTVTNNLGINNSNGVISHPTSLTVAVDPNIYDTDRANIIIYNPGLLNDVNVDLSSLNWAAGSSYRLHNSADYFGDVVTGTLNGQTLPVNMQNSAHTRALPLGWPTQVTEDTFPQFGAFILFNTSAVVAASPRRNVIVFG